MMVQAIKKSFSQELVIFVLCMSVYSFFFGFFKFFSLLSSRFILFFGLDQLSLDLIYLVYCWSLLLLPLLFIFRLFFVDDWKYLKLRVLALRYSIYLCLYTWFLPFFYIMQNGGKLGVCWCVNDFSIGDFSLGLQNGSVSSFFVDHIYNWVVEWNIYYHLGVDGISILFILLTTILIPVCILCSWETFLVLPGAKWFLILLFFMEFCLLNVFFILDLLLFFIFFEGILIPMFLIIGVWGSRYRRIYASYVFFLYTMFGSVFLLVSILFFYQEVGTTDFWFYDLFGVSSTWVQLGLFIGFAVKVPLVPVHLWLPEAHVEAPTSGSVILAGILLKIGGYGLYRFSVFSNEQIAMLAFYLGMFGVIYSGLATFQQVDLKKIIAYSSIGHMGVAVMGLASNTDISLQGGVLVMFAHGFVSSALFICVGILYDRYGTRLLVYYGGLAEVMPIFSVVFLFFILANYAFPGTGNFMGEFILLLSTVPFTGMVGYIAMGSLFGTWFSLAIFGRLCTGPIRVFFFKKSVEMVSDINLREFMILLILGLPTIFSGVQPDFVLELVSLSFMQGIR